MDQGPGAGGADGGGALLVAAWPVTLALAWRASWRVNWPTPPAAPGTRDPVAGVGPGQAQGAGRGHPATGRVAAGRSRRPTAAARSIRPGHAPARRSHARGQRHHPLADVEGGHALAEGGHRPGHVPADDRARRLLARRQDLAPVDRCRLHVEQELTGAWSRLGHVGQGQGWGGRRVGHEVRAWAKPTTPVVHSIPRPTCRSRWGDEPPEGRRHPRSRGAGRWGDATRRRVPAQLGLAVGASWHFWRSWRSGRWLTGQSS